MLAFCCFVALEHNFQNVIGVFFFVLLANSLNLLNLPFYMIDIVKGTVILAAALLDVARNRAAILSR